MANILILYSTTDGHTREICLRLQKVIENSGNQVTLIDINNAAAIELDSFDKIVIGASIRYGKHSPAVYEFIKANAPVLDARPNAFFTVNVVARKAGKNTPDTNPYLKKFLRQIAWKPKILAVFAGKIEYKRYGFLDRTMIRFIMWMTKGPTDPDTNIEFTDWDKVEEFGRTVSSM